MEIKLSEYVSKKIIYKNIYPYNFDGRNDIDEFEKEIKGENYHFHLGLRIFILNLRIIT